MIQSMAEWNILGILGLIGTLFGIIGVILTWRSRRYIGVAYCISTDNLISPMEPQFADLEIFFDKTKIDSFSSSDIFLWNRGNRAIRSEDIASTSPLTISILSPKRALSYKVLYCSSPHSKIELERRDERFLVTFDFLNPRDGCIFEILHT